MKVNKNFNKIIYENFKSVNSKGHFSFIQSIFVRAHMTQLLNNIYDGDSLAKFTQFLLPPRYYCT